MICGCLTLLSGCGSWVSLSPVDSDSRYEIPLTHSGVFYANPRGGGDVEWYLYSPQLYRWEDGDYTALAHGELELIDGSGEHVTWSDNSALVVHNGQCQKVTVDLGGYPVGDYLIAFYASAFYEDDEPAPIDTDKAAVSSHYKFAQF